jgi:hypothetical protein
MSDVEAELRARIAELELSVQSKNESIARLEKAVEALTSTKVGDDARKGSNVDDDDEDDEEDLDLTSKLNAFFDTVPVKEQKNVTKTGQFLHSINTTVAFYHQIYSQSQVSFTLLATVIQLSTRGTVGSDNWFWGWLNSQCPETTICKIITERL